MAWLRLVYHHIIYWTVGTTPEEHHANLANSWYELNRYRNCIEHCQKYLGYADSDQVKAIMAYCHGALGEWEPAAAAYGSISKIWSVPSFALGLAEAELRCGNIDEARKIVTTVEVSYPSPKYDVALSLEQLNRELADAAATE
jgi:hypothetical protein